MSEPLIPYGRQWIDSSDIEEVVRALEGELLTTGPRVGDFEEALCSSTGAEHAVAVNSGTAALHAAYHAAGLGPGDEIITSPLTFAATANAALYLGATVRFVDIDPLTGTLDPALVAAAINDRTRILAPVDYAGHPADYPALREVADRHGLLIVADAAHSLGATLQGRQVGTLADVTVTSFHPVKIITTAEGGALLTDDEEMANRGRVFRNHGIDPTAEELASEGPWFRSMHHLGFNYRLSDLHCALGLSQLRRLGAFIERRRAIAARYTETLSDLASLRLPRERAAIRSSWHLYVVRLTGESGLRRPFFDSLRQRGLGVQVHYTPVHFQPYFRALGHRRGSCPRAEDFYSRCVSLPIFPAMTDGEVEAVIERVRATAQEILGPE